MILFRSKGQVHIPGYKELSKHEEVINLGSKEGSKVYFPTLTPRNAPIKCMVQPGDKVKVGQLIMVREDMYVPIYSPVSGTVLPQEKIFSTNIGRAMPHLVIENDGLDAKGEKLKTVSLENTQEEIFAAIKEAGLVGMGGAGFPTYIKYQNPKNIETLLVNGIECEPFITTDFVTMQQEAHLLMKGCQLLMKASGASKALICIKVHKQEVVDALNAVIGEYQDISYAEMPDRYPMGWERCLIKQALHKEYKALPAECGVVINNAQTVISIAKVLLEGTPITDKMVTVSGDGVKHPTNVICKIGTQAKELIEACGGPLEGDVTLIPGGPMCGRSVNNADFPMQMQMGALTLLKTKKAVSEPCLRCGACTNNCPTGLQPVEIKRAFQAKDYQRLMKLNVLTCMECGTCSYVCPSKIELTETMKNAKTITRFKMSQMKK